MDTVIEILIDVSGSMGAMKGTQHENKYLLPDGSTRISLAKATLINEILPTVDYATKIIIRTFKSDSTKEDNPIIDILYDGDFKKELLNQKISSLPSEPFGGTPITRAIEESVDSLKGFPNHDRKIILITDGQENGGGDYKIAAEKAMSLHGIPCRIFIIGIGLEKDAAEKATELATSTKGAYINLSTKNYDPAKVKQDLAPLKTSVVKDSIQNIKSQPVTTTSPAKEKIEILEKKLESVGKEEKQIISFDERFKSIESKIEEHILNSQKILSELETLKQFKAASVNLEIGVDATTLTIDPDYSESIRQRSESFVYQILIEKHGLNKVRWLNINGESYSNHDFEILDEKGSTINLIECVGTPKYKQTFYLTANEWKYFLNNTDKYQIYRVFNVESSMSHVCIANLFIALKQGNVVPYLLAPETLKEHRVFLTIISI